MRPLVSARPARPAVLSPIHGPDWYPAESDRTQVLKVWRDGALVVEHGYLPDSHDREIDIFEERAEVSGWLRSTFTVARELLIDLGAHGDVRLCYRLSEGRTLHWRPMHNQKLERAVQITLWTRLDVDEEATTALTERVEAEIGRALGLGPEPPPAEPG